MPRPRKSTVEKWIKPYKELHFDGEKIVCNICDVTLSVHLTAVLKHVHSYTHECNTKKEKRVSKDEFFFDLALLLISLNLPWSVLNNAQFICFLNKYCVGQHVPSESLLRKKILNELYEKKLEDIRSDLQNGWFWVSIDETADFLGNKVANLLVRKLHVDGPGKCHLVASKVLETVNGVSVFNFFENTLKWLWQDLAEENLKRVVVFTSDSVSYMLSTGKKIKKKYPQVLHVTCLSHALHRVCEKVRDSFTNVDELIANMKKIFLKAPSRIKYFQEKCPNLPLPPKPVITRWGTWINAACYYHGNFNLVKEVVETLNEDATAITHAKNLMNIPNIKNDFKFISEHFQIITRIIENLQCPNLSLEETFQKLDTVQKTINEIPGEIGEVMSKKWAAVLQRNPGLAVVFAISKKIKTEPDAFLDQVPMNIFRYALLTSVDCERSFSTLKWIFSVKRNRLSHDNLEKILTIYWETMNTQ